jgi:hypothetical protein
MGFSSVNSGGGGGEQVTNGCVQRTGVLTEVLLATDPADRYEIDLLHDLFHRRLNGYDCIPGVPP